MTVGASSTRSQERYDRFAEAVDTPMLIITIFWLPVLIVPLVTPVHGAVAASLDVIDLTVWALFAFEYIVKFALAPDRWHYFKTHILELVIVVVPFLRPLRLVVMLGRVGVVFAETLRRAKSILTHNGFHFIVLTVVVLVFVCAGLVTFAERHARGANIHDFGQGLWWAIVTVTTVGYGDRYPVTPLGQGIAVFLMLVGIGLIGALTATIASYFVHERTTQTEERLDRIEALLTQLVGAGNGNADVHLDGQLETGTGASESADQTT